MTDMNNHNTQPMDDMTDLDLLEMELDQPAQPGTTGRLRPVQQRNRRMARRALVAKLTGG